VTSHTKWTIDWRAVALFVIACTLVVALFAFLQRGSGEVEWPVVHGTVQDTRIVIDHADQTKWGTRITWKAEYKVTYSVGDREYVAWADSGIRDESEDGVRLALPRLLPSCRVRYNPKKPEASIAGCR
jgi:hypothetical protein